MLLTSVLVFLATTSPVNSTLYVPPGVETVTLVNPTPVDTAEGGTMTRGETCEIGPHGRVSLVGEDIAGKRILLRYRTSKVARATTCPTGALFFLPRTWLNSAEAAEQKRDQDEVLVRKLLYEEAHGASAPPQE